MQSAYGSIETAPDDHDNEDESRGDLTGEGGDIPKVEEEISIEEALEKSGFHKNQVLCLLVLSIVDAATYAQLEAINLLGPELLCEWNLSGVQESIVTGSIFIGCAVGAPFWGKASDQLGRRFILLASCLTTFIFIFISIFSRGYLFFTISRLLAGVSFGALHISYTYATEIVSAQHRTTASTFLFASQWAGILFGSILGMLVIPQKSLGWEIYQGITSSFFFLSFILMILIPETPRFLLTSGRSKEALEVIQWFNPESNQLVRLKPVPPEERGSYLTIIKDFSCFKKLVAMMIVSAMIALVKSAVALLFLETLQNPKTEKCFLVSGYEHVNEACDRLKREDYFLEIILTFSQIVAAIIAKPMADYFGRRKSLLIFGLVSLIHLGSFFFCKPDLVQTFLTLSCSSVITSALLICFLYINELFPTAIRGVCYGIILSGMDIGLAVAPIFVQYLSKISYPAAVSSLMLFAVFWILTMLVFQQETKNVAQEDSSRTFISK